MEELDCDAVVFDLDGVLVDSAACIERHWRRWASERGLDGDAVMLLTHGRPTVDTIRLAAPHLPAEAEATRLNAWEASDVDGVAEVEGAVQLVCSLPPSAWAIATSGTRGTALTRLRRFGIPIPGVLVTADDITRGKPNPEVYLLAAAKLDVLPACCVALEDTPAGISAARAAGMHVVALATTHPQVDLKEAHMRADRLRDIRISTNAIGAHGRLTVRITET
ncbi:MAG TPA: HAD-IA family hydrolase [Terriglobia bacterium]|nr:HAD-IA family hydrolase [Terriglobia bacterium]